MTLSVRKKGSVDVKAFYLVALVALTHGCGGIDVGVHATDKDASQPLTCNPIPMSTGAPACDNCVAASCCTEDEACGGDVSCASFISCLSQCTPNGGTPDPQCESSCTSSYPAGANELVALGSCIQAQCSTDCGP